MCPVVLNMSYAWYMWNDKTVICLRNDMTMMWLWNDMTMKCLWYDMTMICYINVMTRVMMWCTDDTIYVMVLHVWQYNTCCDMFYDMTHAWYDMIWHMHDMIWYVERYVMCMIWHKTMYDMKDTIFNLDTCLKDYVVKWYDMKEKWKGLFYMIMNENVATSCIILFLHRRISHFYNVSNAYVMRQKNDHYVNIMLRQSLFLSGVRQQLQRMLAPIKKGA